MTPSEQAEKLGLEYGGFGGWIDPKTRKVQAYTVDGKLVRKEDADEERDEDLGRVIILNLDKAVVNTDLKDPTPEQAGYIKLIRAVIQSGEDFIVLTERNVMKKVALFLKNIGVTASASADNYDWKNPEQNVASGVTLAPYGNSDPKRKKQYVAKKIKEGYSEIQYFDWDRNSLSAVDSLKAPYNKLDVLIQTHVIPTLTPKKQQSL